MPLLLACSSAPPTFEQCEDPGCRSASLEAAWTDDPEGTSRTLLALSDQVEQAALVQRLLEQHPDAQAVLCPHLPEASAARFTCDRKRTRPHLDVQLEPDAPPVAASEGEAAPVGPGMQRLDQPPAGPLPWDDATDEEIAAAARVCAAAPVPERCAEERAAELAVQGSLRDAGLTCLGLDPSVDRAHDECLFRAAEALARTHQPPAVGSALSWCGRNRWFGRMCTSHVLTWLAPEQAAAGSAPDVEQAVAMVAAVRAVAGADRALADAYADQLWGRWTATVALRRPTSLNRVFDALPAEAAPHVRMARAYRLALDLDEERAATAPLDQLAALVDQPWRRSRSHSASATVGPHALPDAWAEDLAGEEALPWVACMGPRRRAISEDPAIDRQLVLLEALAMRQPPPPAGRFFDLVGSDAPEVVRWTAARLGQRLYPDQAAQLRDPAALVQQRLAGAPELERP